MERCPKCNNELNYDEVDIGVGVMKGNFRCDFCGWYQEEEIDKLLKVKNE